MTNKPDDLKDALDRMVTDVFRGVIAADGLPQDNGIPSWDEFDLWRMRHLDPEGTKEYQRRIPGMFELLPNYQGKRPKSITSRKWPELHSVWMARESRPSHPLAVVARKWLNRPVLVRASRRTKNRIIPARVAMGREDDPQVPKLLSPIPDEATCRQLALPGFKEPLFTPALPLHLFDMGMGSTGRDIRSAPVALRLLVTALSMAPMDGLNGGKPIFFNLRYRRVIDELYPGDVCRPSYHKVYDRLIAAVDAINHRDNWIPVYDPDEQAHSLRQVVIISSVPRNPKALDDTIQVGINLPKGSGIGPRVPDSLKSWGVKSARAYRALLNLTYAWYRPGRIQLPIGPRLSTGAKGTVMSKDIERYPSLTDDYAVFLCFPTSETQQRRKLVARGHETIELLADAQDLKIVEGHIIPPFAS